MAGAHPLAILAFTGRLAADLGIGNLGLDTDGTIIPVANHGTALLSTSGWRLVIPYGSRHDAGMNTIFLQPR